MAENRQKWILKNADGLVIGPFTTEQILIKIRSGDVLGEEWISLYPGSQWRPISQDPQFYDYLLDVLSGKDIEDVSDDTLDPSQNTAKTENLSESREVFSGSDIELDDDAIDAFTVSKTGSLDDEDSSIYLADDDEDDDDDDDDSQQDSKVKRRKKSKGSFQDIELVDIKKRFKSELVKRARLPLFILIIVIVAAVFLLSGEENSDERVRLLAPAETSTETINEQVGLQRLKRSYQHYLRDTFKNYLAAQNELIQLIEGRPKEVRAMSLLCMTYFELWPYARQDSTDFRTVNKMVQMSSKIDPAGLYSSTCRVVDLFVRGRFVEAKNLVESVLESEATQGRAPIDFYYLKAVLLAHSKEYLTAIGYLQSAEKLEPQRLRVFVYEAELHMKRADYPLAGKILRRVLDANKSHPVAQVLLGIIEVRHFRHFDRAQNLLTSGLSHSDAIPTQLLSEGYFSLAEIAVQKNDSSKALANAKKAYSSNSTNEAAKNLILNLEGPEGLKKTKLEGQQLIFEGDQFVREGACNVAVAHYKAAFELDRSAVAAMKAAKCLWKLSFSTEATDWLQEAIKADKQLIEAYVLLADYYTQRYNFVAAASVLAQAQRSSPQSYEVYRGLALVELRRNSPKSAINYGKKALTLYETDVETHIIVTEAYLLLKDYRSGYAHAAKAIEIDANNRKAQIVYGEALAGIQGVETGIGHLLGLVQTYPLVTEYRMALGKLYAQDERYAQAEDIFRQVIQIEEKPKDAYLELGKVLRKLDRYEAASDSLHQAARLDPADAEPLFQAGLLYLELKKPNEASERLRRVLRINQRYPLAHYWLGKAALERGDANEALNHSQEERKVNPQLADAYLLAAEAYTHLNQYTLCAREYQKAIKLRPQGASIYVNLARCYRLSGNLDVAEAMLNHASAQESGFAPIYKEQGEVYEKKGDIERAVEAYNQYFILNPNAPDRTQIENRINRIGR